MSESLRLRSLLAMGVSAAALLGAAPALAQGQTTAQPNDTGPATVGEVVVTAQKREEAIQDVPIAVSAFSQDTLEKAKIDGGPNLVVAIPNVNFSKGNFTGYNFQIRGIGSKLVAGNADAGTGIHLNNAPLTANNLFEAEFYDVERVEVLRGPQGTLYGRNATGGVVNVITAKPVDHFQAMVRGEVGNFNTRKARAMVNVPLGDMFAVRVAGAYLKRDGFGKNIVTGNDADDRNLYAYRVTLGFNPTDTFRTTLMYDVFDEDDNRSRIGKQLCSKDPGPTTIGGAPFSSDANAAQVERGFFNQGCLATSPYASDILGSVNSQGTLGGFYGALSGLTTGDAYAGKMQDPDIRNIESYFDPIYQSHTDIAELNVDWDLTESLKLTSLTSYSKNELFTKQDYNRYQPTQNFNTTPNEQNVFAGPIGQAYLEGFLADPGVCGPNYDPEGACAAFATPLFPTLFGGGLTPPEYGQAVYTGLYQSLFPGGVVTDPQIGAKNHFATIDISSAYTKQWTQELRLQSNYAGPFNFNVGGIYIDFRGTGDYYVMFNTGTAFYQVNNALNTGNPNCAATNPACVYIDPSKDPDRSGHNYYDSYAPYHLKSRAVFGEFYYQMTDALKWTLGLRYTDDTKLVEQHEVALGKPGSGVLGAPATDPAPIKKVEFKETTGRFGVDWKPHLDFTDETLLYAFLARGYKAGGVNPPCSFQCTQYSSTFEPEFVDSIEVGTKNTLAGGSVLLNLTGFHYNYKGYQVSKIVNRTSVNENIDAKIWGLELESIWTPVRALRFNTAIGYLDTSIGNSQSIDVFNRTQGDPNLVLVKTGSASNCVVPLLTAQTYLGIANASSPFFIPLGGGGLPGICDTAGASDGVPVNLKGKELPNSPHWTFSVGAQYTLDLTSDWTATLRGDYYKQTDSYARIYNSTADKIKGWQNVNATLTFDNDPWNLSVELYVKNATDEEAINDFYLTDDSSGLFRNAFYGDPRTYGLAITKKF
jgi:outer membrane receptor protein involved in Fe transport